MSKVIIKVNAFLSGERFKLLKEDLERQAKEDSFVLVPCYCDVITTEGEGFEVIDGRNGTA